MRTTGSRRLSRCWCASRGCRLRPSSRFIISRSREVFGKVTRTVGEKGFDILMPVLDRLLADDVRLIILGKGDPAYETALGIASRKYPTRLAYQREYDEALAHLIEGGSDIALIPSRVE